MLQLSALKTTPGEVSAQQWQQFYRRSHQVTRISATSFALDPPSLERLEAIITHHSGSIRPIFPRIEDLKILHLCEGMAATTRLLLGPQTSSLIIENENGGDDVLEIFQDLIHRSPFITQLRLWTPSILPQIDAIGATFTSLRSFDYESGAFSWTAWKNLAESCPSLKVLRLTDLALSEDVLPTDVHDVAVFPSLTKLELTMHDSYLSLAIALLNSSVPSLTKLHIVDDNLTAEKWQDLMDTLPLTLRHLEFQCESVTSLSAVRHLTYLSLATIQAYSGITVEDFKAFARDATGNLETLHLSFESPHRMGTVVFFRSLATHAKKLKDLTIAASTKDLPRPIPSPAIPFTCLKTLKLIPLYAGGLEDLTFVRFLAETCPDLEKLIVYDPSGWLPGQRDVVNDFWEMKKQMGRAT